MALKTAQYHELRMILIRGWGDRTAADAREAAGRGGRREQHEAEVVEVGRRDLARVDAAEELDHGGELDTLLRGHAGADALLHAELHAQHLARRRAGLVLEAVRHLGAVHSAHQVVIEVAGVALTVVHVLF